MLASPIVAERSAGGGCQERSMRFAGMLLLLAGWGIVISAVVLFPLSVTQSLFVFAGMGLQGLGLFLAFRSGSRLPEEAK